MFKQVLTGLIIELDGLVMNNANKLIVNLLNCLTYHMISTNFPTRGVVLYATCIGNNAIKKTYKGGFEALKGIDLSVKEGDFFALLGPNGAGKSTTIGIITSLVNKTAGQVEVFGHSIDSELETAKSYID